MSKKTLIIDCDGVLYPSAQLPLQDFVSAMKNTYRTDYNIDGETQQRVSEQTIAQKKLGLFNYVKTMCEVTDHSFEEFCQKMFDKINYDQITPDKQLLQLLLTASQKDEVVILTNNHRLHLDKVLHQRFGKSVFEFEEMGIKCYDIRSTEINGTFYPKQDPKGLKTFANKISRRVEDCILLDDSPRNIDAANLAGMQGVLITPEHSLKFYLNSQYGLTQKTRSGKEND